MKVVGIDPGTKSMDVCGLENGEVYYEKTVDTMEVAENPEKLINTIKETGEPDLIAAPSGYGVEPTKLNEIPQKRLEEWYYNYILLTEKVFIERARKNGVFGAELYHAMTESIKQMKKLKSEIIFIPGVINLETVPKHKKLNKIDMGTADKLAVTTLGIHTTTQKNQIDYKDVDCLVLEMGFGYNSIIKVRGGKVVDGLGGTTMPGPGFLTASTLDLEVVQLGKTWDKQDVFQGGAQTIAGVETPKELMEKLDKPEAKLGFDAMIDGIVKGVKSLKNKDELVLLSGRLKNHPEITDELQDKLKNIDLREMDGLPGAEKTKKTAQGYAVVADGYHGGKYKKLINHIEIKKANGTSIDYLHHPKVKNIKKSFTKFKKQ
ncbi:putative butyrate kinase [Methanonatronarchaeum thermophilum]|uniref:Putative butyrate kinase n=1 Tax=Methanonatronarchaeum thermophilum TaxID=1927129 RepID=A0A1Y3GDR8_9EURY|nr:DUF1464 family protein [Methanonatronarchaeum thermophilum]OUJ19539.1 putative butyrate kinase [Methanonatronarchaeum thermophilum]